jgi:hypothetical protein
LVLTLRADNVNIIKWWVDAAFAIHKDMGSHTGGVMSMGAGAIYSSSQKQKMNTNILTEAELVGANDVLPQALWTQYFMGGQGYTTENVLYQDDQSTMKLEQNGKASSGKRTRHINIRYFFNTDRIAKKEIAVQYCPTKQMVADYFTKPLQSALFYKFRDQILGLAPMETIHGDQRRVLDSDSNPACTEAEHSANNRTPRKSTGMPCKTTGILKKPPGDVRKRLQVVHSHRTWAEVAKPNKRPTNRGMSMQPLSAA